jgi:hypothetical protein
MVAMPMSLSLYNGTLQFTQQENVRALNDLLGQITGPGQRSGPRKWQHRVVGLAGTYPYACDNQGQQSHKNRDSPKSGFHDIVPI